MLYDADSETIANDLIENIALKLLEVLPAGLLRVHLFDYDHRKRFMHLADLQAIQAYRVALDSQQASNQFDELEKISQHRYHNLFSAQAPNLSQYNAQNDIAETYHVLLIHLADYPDDLASPKRLKAFMEAAYDAGFYCIAFAQDDSLETTHKAAQVILDNFPSLRIRDKRFQFTSELFPFADAIDPMEFEYLNDNKGHIVEQLLQRAQNNSDSEEQEFIRLPIGASSDGRKPFYFSLGDQSKAYHAFIIGQTGSGKTTLLNNLILGIAKHYGSGQLHLYLMDYKEGVEFQVFQQHPNCQKIFLDNQDLDAAVSLLQEFAATLQQRGELFKQTGVNGIHAYNQRHPEQALPRLLLIIDEVHRLFSGSFKQQKHFSDLLTQVVRQGRAFGVHIILATQTLAGANIDKELLSQITLRLSYKVSDQRDAELLFGWGNTVAMELGKYELLYNADAGNKAANLRCKTAPPQDIVSLLAQYRAARVQQGKTVLTPVVVKSQPAETDAAEKPAVERQNVEKALEMTREFDTADYAHVLEQLKGMEGKEKSHE